MKITKKMEDRFSPSDSEFYVRGEVEAFLNGEFLFKKHNIITNNGRKYIFEKFLNAFLKDISNNYSDYAFSYIGFGTSEAVSKPDINTLSDKKLTRTIDNNKIKINIEKRSITFPCEVELKNLDLADGEKAIGISELGLFISKKDHPDILFSRLAFDKIPLGVGDSFSIEYTIYF